MELRCSSLPLIELCAASAKKPEIVIDRRHPAATLGTALHTDEIMASVVDGEEVDLDAVAAEWGVPAHELAFLHARAKEMWGKMERFFPSPKREYEAEWETPRTKLTGHMDLVSVADEQLRILDWKSGRAPQNSEAQLKGYAFLGLKLHPQCDTAYVVALRLRENRTDHGRIYTRGELDDWHARLEKDVLEDKYTPGESHCYWCPRFHECPAKNQILQTAHTAMTRGSVLIPSNPLERAAAISTLYDQTRLAEKFLEDLKAMIKAEVLAAGGTMAITNGRELYIDSQDRATINYKGEKVLREVLGDRYHEAVKFLKTKAEQIVRDGAASGMKRDAVADLLARLEDHGALDHSEHVVLGMRHRHGEIGEAT